MTRNIWSTWWANGRPGAILGDAYDAAFKDWVDQGRHSSGDAPSSLVEFTALNAVRMRRVSKTSKIPASLLAVLQTQAVGKLHWTVITESWCGDAAQTGPLMAAMAKQAGISIHWMLRDSPPLLIDDFLTGGSKSIPLWVISNASGEVLGHWGARPQALQQVVSANKSQPDSLSKQDMAVQIQLWYARDRGRTFFAEAETLLRSICDQDAV